MKITQFQKQVKPGGIVFNRVKDKEGSVLKISKDRDKALVEYRNGTKEWNEYFILELPTPNP